MRNYFIIVLRASVFTACTAFTEARRFMHGRLRAKLDRHNRRKRTCTHILAWRVYELKCVNAYAHRAHLKVV